MLGLMLINQLLMEPVLANLVHVGRSVVVTHVAGEGAGGGFWVSGNEWPKVTSGPYRRDRE